MSHFHSTLIQSGCEVEQCTVVPVPGAVLIIVGMHRTFWQEKRQSKQLFHLRVAVFLPPFGLQVVTKVTAPFCFVSVFFFKQAFSV